LGNKFTYLTIIVTFLGFACEDERTVIPDFNGFKKYYGGIHEEYAYGATRSFDGGFIITGFSTTFSVNSNWDAWVVKIDEDGNGQWAHQFGKAGREVFYAACQASRDQYVFAGFTTSFSRKEDFYIVKVDESGTTLWEKAYGGPEHDAAFDIITTSDGNLAVTGYTYSYGIGGRNMWVMKLSQDGDIIWDVNFGKYYNDMGYALKETADGGFIVVGYTDVYSTQYRYMWMVRLDASGKFLWEKVFDYDGFSMATDVLTYEDGSIIIGGQTDSLKNGWLNYWAVKTDFIGNIIWSKVYVTSSTDTWKMVKTDKGGFTALGTTTHMGQEAGDFLLIHFNTGGEVQWSQTYGGSNFEIGGKLMNLGPGIGYGLTGTTKSFGNGITDYYLIVTDDQGNW